MQRFADDRGGFGAEAHLLLGAKGLGIDPPDGGVTAAHRSDEVFDHPVGVGVVDVEAVELAVGGQIDAGLALGVEDDTGGVDDGLLGR